MFCKNCGQEIKTGANFCKNCGQDIKLKKFAHFKINLFNWFKIHRKGVLIGVAILIGLIILGYFDSTPSSDTLTNNPTIKSGSNNQFNQNEIASSVVNIFCPSTISSEEVSGGSGTIITEDGIILTNSHIIPQDKVNIHVDETGCLVVLPDPVSGQPKEEYLAHPIVIPELSDKYDLAYMEIYSAYYDEDTRQYKGTYPQTFPAFDDTTRCSNEDVQLGEFVRIFGYPAISGGYSLTITDGVVSSFSGDGLIFTSAKISHGNSGGLAVDKNGCMIGVPSMVSSDENESLGILISSTLVNSFTDEVRKYIDSQP